MGQQYDCKNTASPLTVANKLHSMVAYNLQAHHTLMQVTNRKTENSVMQESNTPSQVALALTHIRKLIVDDLTAIDQFIYKELFSEIPLIQSITEHIFRSGGKRLRPLLVILSAKALEYENDSEHHELATIIEFVHTATLLHDDVVDESNLRRGEKTANVIWGNDASVLVGDFLYSRAFQILARRNNIPVMTVLANTTNAIAEGEILQLMNRHDPEINENIYMEVIKRKTAKLFESAAEIGAIIGKQNNPQRQKAMADYGLHLGLAFQIIDDLLDYTATANQIGKNIGDDLAEGKITLPLIHALHHAKPSHANVIRKAIKQGALDQFDVILEALAETKAKDYCINKAYAHADLASTALQLIPESKYRKSLQDLIEFSIKRNH